MKIYFTKEFLRKADTPNYPLKGFWCQLGNKIPNKPLLVQWVQSNTELIPCNTFITDTGFRFSFDILNSNNISNKTSYIYLIALDLNIYNNIESNFNGPKDPLLFGQLAALIDLEIDKDVYALNKKVTNIFNIDYKLKCSFNLVYSVECPQVNHYNSSYIGKSNYYNIDTEDYQLIDKGSSLDRVREILSYNRPSELQGSFTIRKSGIIQL